MHASSPLALPYIEVPGLASLLGHAGKKLELEGSASSSFCFTLLQKPGVEGHMQWFSSIAARVAQLKEPRSAEPNV